jgi:type VII secretion effector (TIGR04197 family)
MSYSSIKQNTQTACQPNMDSHEAIRLLAEAINDLARTVQQDHEKLKREIDDLERK